MIHNHGHQTGLKNGGAERNFETYLVKSSRLIDHQPMKHPSFQDFDYWFFVFKLFLPWKL